MSVVPDVLKRLYPRYNSGSVFSVGVPAHTTEELFAHSLIRSIDRFTGPQVGSARWWACLRSSLSGSLFMPSNAYDAILDNFGKGMRAYLGFSMLARRYKIAKAKDSGMTTDLFGEELEHLPPHTVISMYDDATRSNYRFRVSDLLRIVNSSLCNSPGLFSMPLWPRNPFTNLPFTEAQLLNLYEHVRRSRLPMPLILQEFIRHGLDLDAFSEEMEPMIRNRAVRALVRNADVENKAKLIRDMMDDVGSVVGASSIDEDFPDQALVDALGRYLEDYLMSMYSICPGKKAVSIKRCGVGLKRFYRRNPTFGRRITKLVSSAVGGPRTRRTTFVTQFSDPDVEPLAACLPTRQRQRQSQRRRTRGRRPRRSIGVGSVTAMNPFSFQPLGMPGLMLPTVSRTEEMGEEDHVSAESGSEQESVSVTVISTVVQQASETSSDDDDDSTNDNDGDQVSSGSSSMDRGPMSPLDVSSVIASTQSLFLSGPTESEEEEARPDEIRLTVAIDNQPYDAREDVSDSSDIETPTS